VLTGNYQAEKAIILQAMQTGIL